MPLVKNASITDGFLLVNPGLIVAASLLCVAAVSKNHSGCAGCPQFCMNGSCALHLAIATFEYFVAAVAFARSSSQIVWVTMLCIYAGFASWNIFLVLNEHSSCGCFGRISVSPWVMLVLDLGMLFVIVNSTTIVVPVSSKLRNCTRVFGIGVFALTSTVWFSVLSSNLDRANSPIKRAGNNVFVDVPQLDNLSSAVFFETFGIGSPHSEEKWLILRGSCDHCVEVAKTVSIDVNVLAIEPDSLLVYVLKSRNLNYTVENPELHYMFQTPLFVEIKGGRVIAANVKGFSRNGRIPEEE